ncbi:uncharacterized protein LY89DRAFT_776084 [Mollisia scopiformis]|uniref:Uncharacterized protein n=1 Tax=Mollisia scopiformis TaxID=149040 RepID=A0A194XUH4_MOLSC|nr:uncharacterized protein LY89DRAFT_776084 [Mollisia scopiformis]KUJ23863.1 hypothetical protein LY89DRAFT_776084 [Mollisia scopiformis]
MGNARPQRRDLEYGYPTIEQGIQSGQVSKCDSLEILRYGSEFRHSNERLDGTSLSAWLSKTFPTAETTADDFRGGLRLLVGVCRLEPLSGKLLLPFTKDDFEFISQRLQLPEQFSQSMQARIPCAYKFTSPTNVVGKASEPVICYIFKFGIHRPSYYHLVISYCPSTNITHALLLSKTSDHTFESIFRRIELFKQHITHPFLLPVLLSEICLVSSENRVQLSDDRLNGLEELMGQHEWINRPVGDPLKLDFVTTTRALNFTSRNLGVEKMRVQGQLLCLSNLLEEVELLHKSYPCSEDTYTWMKETIANHRNTAKYLLVRTDYEEKRVQTQLAVVYQFMQQKDSKVNIQLAETSATIARESKKDSSAMKAIAVLTMCFLPGTFLATIFAMPLFNWDSNDGPGIKGGFRLYWAIAIPLTVGVLLIWIISMTLPWNKWIDGLLRRKRLRSQSNESGEMTGLKND